MKKGELIYLAAPYSHKSKKVMSQRFLRINKVAAVIMGKGYYLYSPISHTHQSLLQDPCQEAGISGEAMMKL